MMELLNIVDRKHEIRTLPEPATFVKQRIAQAAQDLNRAGDMQCHVEIANEALCKFAGILYQKDSDGTFANIDNRTHRLLVPAPWGKRGWKYWGLRHWEATILRSVLISRLAEPRPPLFDYNAHTQTWYLNVADYKTLDAANYVLHRCAITVSEWRLRSEAYHNREMERKRNVAGR